MLDNGLHYPWGFDQRDLTHAQEDAVWLANWLSKMSDRVVNVASVLVLPGWYIDRRAKISVTVLSGSEVATNIPKLRGIQTTESEIRRFAAMIEDRNRSTEY